MAPKKAALAEAAEASASAMGTDVSVAAAPSSSHREPKKKEGKRVTTLARLEHEEHTSEEARQRRAEAATEKQRIEHATKVAGKVVSAAAKARAAEAEAGARAAAATHVVPSPPSLNELIAAKLALR